MQTTQKNSKTKLPWFSRLLQHSARMGLFYKVPAPNRDQTCDRIMKFYHITYNCCWNLHVCS